MTQGNADNANIIHGLNNGTEWRHGLLNDGDPELNRVGSDHSIFVVVAALPLLRRHAISRHV